MTPSDFANKSLLIWLLYLIERISTISNYITGKDGTSYTPCVHRIRSRPVTLQGRMDDLTVIHFENFQRDPSLDHLRCEPTLFDEMRKVSLRLFPLGSLVAYFDQQNNRYLYISGIKRRFLNSPTYESLEVSLQASKQHLKRHSIQEIAIPKLACGYDHLHWPTDFSFLFTVFCRFKLHSYNNSNYAVA